MHQISLADAEHTLPKLIQDVQSGEEIIIFQNKKPVARLTSVIGSDVYPGKKIKSGSAKGLIKLQTISMNHSTILRNIWNDISIGYSYVSLVYYR
jgi:antitoxin (DNA-binding transcriptional repressor) of toxin-antitoxin stability system